MHQALDFVAVGQRAGYRGEHICFADVRQFGVLGEVEPYGDANPNNRIF